MNRYGVKPGEMFRVKKSSLEGIEGRYCIIYISYDFNFETHDSFVPYSRILSEEHRSILNEIKENIFECIDKSPNVMENLTCFKLGDRYVLIYNRYCEKVKS